MPPPNPNRRRQSPKGHRLRPEHAACFLCPFECHALEACGAADLYHALLRTLAAESGGPQRDRWAAVARACRAEAERAGAGPDALERALAAAVPDADRRRAVRGLVAG